VLTSITASGQTDEPSARDFYYYVAFVHGAGANVSAASNQPAGALNYHLGDVTDGATAGQGNNAVNTADISLLGAHYGLSGAVAVAPFAYLDVGPTTDFSTLARPTTDNEIDFEDLVLFAIDYEVVASPALPAAARPAGRNATAAADELSFSAPSQVLSGASFAAALSLAGSGSVQALTVRLEWDPAVVHPVAAQAAAHFQQLGGLVLTPHPGVFDAALLGPQPGTLAGNQELGSVTFEATAAGDPRIRIVEVRARDAVNHNVPVGISNPTVGVPGPQRFIPAVTGLAPPAPNPIRQSTAFTVSLAQGGPVRLDLYSVDGRRVRTLLDETREAGEYRIAWDGRDGEGRAAAPGVYFVRLTAGARGYTRNLVYLR
jgi:hypothetical protein